MSDLTSRLKSQHQQILSLLEEVRQIGVGKPEALVKLKSAKAILLAHLKMEESQLYPVLFKAAKKNEDLTFTLAMLAKDMEGISKEIMTFFENCDQSRDPFEVAMDFGRVASLLKTRIRREEESLYKEFDDLATAT